MTTPTGAISFANLQTEFGGSNPISINEYYGPLGGVGTPTSGTISMNQLRNKNAQIQIGHHGTWYIHNAGSSYSFSSMNGYNSAAQTGDIIIFTCCSSGGSSTPTGYTTIDAESSHSVTSNCGKGCSTTTNYSTNVSYKILTGNDTSVSGYSSGTNVIAVSVFRPTTGSISSVNINNSTTTGNTGGTLSASGSKYSHLKYVVCSDSDEPSISLSGAEGTINSGNGWGQGNATLDIKTMHDDDASYANTSWTSSRSSRNIFGYLELVQ